MMEAAHSSLTAALGKKKNRSRKLKKQKAQEGIGSAG